MPPYLRLLYLLLIASLTLSGCTAVSTGPTPAQPTQTATLQPITASPSASLTPTQTSRPTRTLRSTQTLTPTLSPTRTVEPAPVLEPNHVLENFQGEWSPAASELAGVLQSDEVGAGRLALASAPNFYLSILDAKNRVNAGIAWTPDGRTLLYGAQVEGDWEEGDPTGIPSTLWIFENTRKTSKPTAFSYLRYLSFWGWMDSQTVVLKDYNGGGSWQITAWNYRENQIQTSERLQAPILGALNPKYAPAVLLVPYPVLVVIDRQPNTDNPYCELLPCNSRGFPTDLQIPGLQDFYYLDWLPGTNKMLVAAFGARDGKPTARLLSWDVDTDQVTSVMPGGVHGQYSPDGSLLAWVTHAPAHAYPAHGPLELDAVDPTEQPYLHIMELESQRVLLSLPVHTRTDRDLDDFLHPLFSFSPAGRYIYLITPDIPVWNSEQWINAASSAAHTDMWHMAVIDLESHQLLKVIEMDEDIADTRSQPIWSPSGDRFVYRDRDQHWYLLDLNTSTIHSLRSPMGELLSSPSWSHDGRYLSLFSDSIKHTYIFDLDK
jgi:hypothetical protein